MPARRTYKKKARKAAPKRALKKRKGTGKRFRAKANLGWGGKRRTMKKAATTGKAIVATTTFTAHTTISPNVMYINGKKRNDTEPALHAVLTRLSLKPQNIIELEARQFLYGLFKIFNIMWMFRKCVAAKETGPIHAEYMEDCRMVLVPNLMNEDLPVQGTYTATTMTARSMYHFCRQQKGAKVVPLDRKSASIKVPATVVKNMEFQAAGSDTGVQQSKPVPMPWLELNIDNLSQMSVGQIYVYQPGVMVNTYYEVFHDDASQNGSPGSTVEKISEQFKYIVTCKVRWGVKRKHLDNSLGVGYGPERAPDAEVFGKVDPAKFFETTTDMDLEGNIISQKTECIPEDDTIEPFDNLDGLFDTPDLL